MQNVFVFFLLGFKKFFKAFFFFFRQRKKPRNWETRKWKMMITIWRHLNDQQMFDWTKSLMG